MTDPSPLAPVPKLDAEAALRSINQHVGMNLELVEESPVGELGAAFVRWPDGREGVLTRGWEPPAVVQRSADMLRHARSNGVPCPRYQMIHELGDRTTIVIQERLPGTPPRAIDDRLVDAMLGMNDRLADQSAGCSCARSLSRPERSGILPARIAGHVRRQEPSPPRLDS